MNFHLNLSVSSLPISSYTFPIFKPNCVLLRRALLLILFSIQFLSKTKQVLGVEDERRLGLAWNRTSAALEVEVVVVVVVVVMVVMVVVVLFFAAMVGSNLGCVF